MWRAGFVEAWRGLRLGDTDPTDEPDLTDGSWWRESAARHEPGFSWGLPLVNPRVASGAAVPKRMFVRAR